MSRTEAKDVLNLSSSTISYSDDSDDSDDDDNIEDVDIERILSEETKNYEFLDVLPPTPQRPSTRSQSRLSESSAVSSLMSTPPKGRNKESSSSPKNSKKPLPVATSNSGAGAVRGRKRKANDRKTSKDICEGLGIDVDESELREIESKEEVKVDDRVRVDNVIDDLLDLGLGKQKVPGRVKESTADEERLQREYQKLRTKVPLEISGDGRCAILKDDVTTVKKTLECMTALVSVLEKTRDKLVNEDENLTFTPPPMVAKKTSLPKRQTKS